MGYKLLGNQCSKYLWMSSKKYELMKYCFADICSWQSMNWRNPASLNWLLTPKISPSTAIPPKSHEADSNRHLNAFQSCGISLDAEYSSHASVPAALLPAAEQSARSQSYWLLVPKWAVLCCPLNSASCVSLHSGVCGLQAAQVSLLCAPLVLLLLLSGVSAPGSWLQI